MPHVNIRLTSQPEINKGSSDNLVAKGRSENNINMTNDKLPINTSRSHMPPLFLKRNLAHSLTKKGKKKDLHLECELHSKTKHLLSHIEDPLWEKICCEVGKMMGAFAVQKIWDSKLGSFCSEERAIDLCCPTEETAQFINQYSFLILGSLQHYFPAIKTLKTKVKYVN